jgi:hypothetical protein
MKRFLPLCVLGLAAMAARPATAAELKVMAPEDKSIVKGRVEFKLKPQNEANEQFFSNPDVIVTNEEGEEVAKLEAPLDTKTGVCSAVFDTTKVKDGMYNVQVTYRVLLKGSDPDDTEENLVLGVRNGPAKPARFVVQLADRPYKVSTQSANEDADDDGEMADVVVKVYDQRGKLMPAARVTFKVDRGDLDNPADISDSDGEAMASVGSEAAGQVTLTIQVENLAPVKKVIRFVKK